MPLRYYQQDAKDCVQCALEEFDRVLLNLPTGSGKTVVAAHLIKSFVPARCIFLADQDELCTQPLNVIDREAHIIAALEKAKNRASLQSRVVVASSQTLARKKRLHRFPPKFFKYGIVDECHRGAERDREITEYLCQKVIGITATPFKADLQDLSAYYEETAYSLPMLDLIGDGFAPPLKVMTLPVEIDLSRVSKKTSFGETDYDLESVSTTIAPYYLRVAELLREHATTRRIIVFLPLIKSSEAFAAIARQCGISAVHVSGADEDRNEKILAFSEGRVQMICNSDLLSTGVDIPIADCMVNLSPCRSAVKYQQRVGRICRVLPGVIDDIPGQDQATERKARIAASAKPDALIVDFLWQHDKLGVMRASNLIARTKRKRLAWLRRSRRSARLSNWKPSPECFRRRRKRYWSSSSKSMRIRPGALSPAEFGYLIGSKPCRTMNRKPVGRWNRQLRSNFAS
jgi:superfamily II DNA or RNA helicase